MEANKLDLGYLNKSVRKATCSTCRKEIPKQTLRVSCKLRDDYNHLQTSHYHLKCYLTTLDFIIKEIEKLRKEILKHKKEIVLQEL